MSALRHGAVEVGQVDGDVVLVRPTVLRVIDGQVDELPPALLGHAVCWQLVESFVLRHIAGVIILEDVEIAGGDEGGVGRHVGGQS